MPDSGESTLIRTGYDQPGTYVLAWLALIFCFATLSTPLQANFCAPGPNLIDTDDNGLFDFACVGDWNNNGTCEMEEDLRAAILSLDDPGPKLVRVDECSFAPPTVAQGLYGILELPDNITLMGFGDDSLLNGFDENNKQAQQAVITNSDHYGGNSNIVIRDLRIDGGWRDGDAVEFNHARIGIRFTNCTDCSASGVEVTDTLHACLYASNSTRIEFKDSTLKRCGNYRGEGSHFPCVYLYAYNGAETSDVLVDGIYCDGSGSSAMSTRRDTTSSTLNNVVFQNNTLRNTAFYDNGSHRRCFRISGVGSAQYLNNLCVDTGGLSSTSSDGYYSDEADVNASANVLVDGLRIVSATNTPPVQLRKYAENFTLRNITVNGITDSHCLEFETPLRNFSLDGAELLNCGKSGIHQLNLEPSGVAADETLAFRNVEIISVGTDATSDGLLFRAPMKGLVLENVSVNGATGNGASFTGLLEESTISNLDLSNVGGHGILLGGGTRDVNLAYNDVTSAGSDCIFLDGSPAPVVSHQQLTITESGLVDCAGSGIATAPGTLSVRDLEVSDNNIDGVDGDGIEILLAGVESENVELDHNILRNFGRELSGGPRYGIELVGALTGTSIFQNILNDWNDQATYGIYHDVPGSHPTYLCSNPCVGTLNPTECLHALESPAYETDSDADGTVDACEDDDDDGIYGPDDNCPDLSNPFQWDGDQDGHGDGCDNCILEYNPTQGDFDNDSEGDLCDVNDGMIYVRFPGSSTVNWQIEFGFSKWNAYRGDLSVLTSGGNYTQNPFLVPLAARNCRLNAPPWNDTVMPAPGSAVFYLVTGVQGSTEGDLGANSLGDLRSNSFPCLVGAFTGF